ncbi:unnamed protein product [Debaryomyces fabryi]|nr:unnamed protein product [Debaryomyces fabryi]
MRYTERFSGLEVLMSYPYQLRHDGHIVAGLIGGGNKIFIREDLYTDVSL